MTSDRRVSPERDDERVEYERKRAEEAEAVALDFARVLKDHEVVAMPYAWGVEYFPFARALHRHREWLRRQPGGWA